MTEAERQPEVHGPDDLYPGMTSSFQVTFDDALLRSFSELSGDWNPLHNDEEYAQGRGFAHRVAHGAIQQALVSRMVGMALPGKYCFIKGLSTSYLKPVLHGETIRVDGEVERWDAAAAAGRVLVRATGPEGSVRSVTSVDVGMIGHPKAAKQVVSTPAAQKTEGDGRTLLFIGSSSGIARQLASKMSAGGFAVKGVSRSGDADLSLDLLGRDDGDLTALVDYAAHCGAFGVVHFASLRPAKAAPTHLDLSALAENITLHIRPLQALALAVQQRRLPALRRIVVMGSTYARHLFPVKGYEGYAYAKAVTAYFVSDLARDLIRSGVTINAIAPAEVPVGMNASVDPRTQAMLATKYPSGRVTTIEDIESTLTFLLSEHSAALTGQELVLAGGKSI